MQSPRVVSPKKLAHVVFRTAKFRAMIDFYKTFLGASVAFESDQAAFLAYDEEHHRIGILAFNNLKASDFPVPGLEHVAFTFESLDDLTDAYEQRKAHGILPEWCVNHGPTTSLYYLDPDGNRVETQVDNFESPEEGFAFTRSQAFLDNPIGTDFDPEDLLRRVRSGEDHRSIKRRIETGPRKFPGAA
ncbi:hypothetical protein OIDMADRAFT_208471 [Oidiodendron maius Zn]|uniref:VOC domain-containing protein n=1 Tax=Oidiodendron maius (strain Zn) TaxID=913774 RepID=A0A0C3G9P7_OIDMZ|nr:hypothetical protein OIDMADRAFT_208471 [Oidiodendron maius Zn]